MRDAQARRPGATSRSLPLLMALSLATAWGCGPGESEPPQAHSPRARAAVPQRLTGDNQPPVANAGGPYFVVEGSSLLLDGSGSSDPEGGPLTYAWDLDGDGDFDDAADPYASFTGTDGWVESPVSLRVCDDADACDTQTTSLLVANEPPTPTLSPSHQTVTPFESATVFGTWTDPAGPADDFYAYAWDLNGDGTYDRFGMAPYGTTLVVRRH